MKICIDISQIVYEGTGVANYTENLVSNLLTYDKENEYLLIGFSFGKIQKLQDYYQKVKAISPRVQAKFYKLPLKIFNYLWNDLHRISLDYLIKDIDIYFSSDWIQAPSKAKKITTVHDLIIYKYPETSHPEIINTQKKRLKWVKKECDLVLADSYSTKEDLINILSFPKDRIEVVYPGVDQIYFQYHENEAIRVRNKYSLNSDYILTVGTNEPRKNLKRILQAFEIFLNHSLIKDLKVPVTLIIVGKSGWDEINPSLYRSVRSLGFVDISDLPYLYNSAKFLVFASLYEGFGLPVLEAMAANCPVLVSDRGSLKEIAGQAGLFIDPEMTEDIAIQMTKLFIDDRLRRELIEKGRENAEKFRWKKSTQQLINIFHKITHN